MRQEQEPTYGPPRFINDAVVFNDGQNQTQPSRPVLRRSNSYERRVAIATLNGIIDELVHEISQESRSGRQGSEGNFEVVTTTTSMTDYSSITSDVQIEAQPLLYTEKPPQRGRTCTCGEKMPRLVIWITILIVLSTILDFVSLGLQLYDEGIFLD